MTSWEHSKSQVRKAGRTIREYWRSPTLLDEYPGEEQIAIVEAYEVVSWYQEVCRYSDVEDAHWAHIVRWDYRYRRRGGDRSTP